jgi:MFS family permease
MFGQYGSVWRIPGAPTLLIIGVFARLGIGMTPVALLLLVHDATGRYATGGLAVGAYALAGAIANPLTARLADHAGSARVLRWTSALHAGPWPVPRSPSRSRSSWPWPRWPAPLIHR